MHLQRQGIVSYCNYVNQPDSRFPALLSGVAIVPAVDLKCVAENWEEYTTADEFNLAVFNQTEILRRDKLEQKMDVLLGPFAFERRIRATNSLQDVVCDLNRPVSIN